MPVVAPVAARPLRGRSLVVALAALFAACATPAFRPSEVIRGPDDAIVLLSISGNTGRIGPVSSVGVVRHGAMLQTFALTQLPGGVASDTAMFAAVVPFGEYEVSTLQSGDATFLIPDKTREQLGRFQVRRGGVTDLGRLVVTSVNLGLYIGRSALVTSNVQLVKRTYPADGLKLTGDVGSGWLGPRAGVDRVEEYALGRPVGARTFVELPGGEVAAASRLGTILLRSLDGKWRGAHTGSLESLLAVAVPPLGQVDGTPALLVAVGELGTLARLDRDGRVRLLSSGDLPPGNLFAVAGSAALGWFVGHQAADRISIYHSTRLDGGTWTEVGAESVKAGWGSARAVWMWPTAAGFSYATTDGRVVAFDFDASAWSVRNTPDGEGLTAIAAFPGDMVGATLKSGRHVVSRDGGATWSVLATPYTPKAWQPPAVLPDGTLLLVNGPSEKISFLHSSRDGGATWKRHGGIDSGDQLVVLPTAGTFRTEVSSAITTIERSTDGGATWETEYTTFDRAMLDEQLRRAEEARKGKAAPPPAEAPAEVTP